MTIHRLQHAGQILLKEIIGLQRVEDEPAQFKLFSHWERQPNKINQSTKYSSFHFLVYSSTIICQ